VFAKVKRAVGARLIFKGQPLAATNENSSFLKKLDLRQSYDDQKVLKLFRRANGEKRDQPEKSSPCNKTARYL
jgi:hypothetical protein